MAEKKATKSTNKIQTPKKKPSSKTKTQNKARSTRSKKQSKEEISADMGIVIVEDDLSIDREKVNEERRAYLEEARSQEAFD